MCSSSSKKMYSKNFVFYITLIVLLKHSVQDNPEMSSSAATITNTENVITEAGILHKTRYTSPAKGTSLWLFCNPEEGNNGNATWQNIQTDSNLSINTTSDGVSMLSIKNVMHDYTFDCKQSDKIIERVVVTVNGPQATIITHSSNFVRKGGKIHLSCVIRSHLPVTNSYLRVQNAVDKQHYVAHWESKRWICTDDDFSRTDCQEETTFQYNVEVQENGLYFCGCENAESVSHYVEVIKREDLIIAEATGLCSSEHVQETILQFAIEALEKYGLKTDAANHIREKCEEYYTGTKWSCIIGIHDFGFSLSPHILDNSNSSLRFSLGSLSFSVFRTKTNEYEMYVD